MLLAMHSRVRLLLIVAVLVISGACGDDKRFGTAGGTTTKTTDAPLTTLGGDPDVPFELLGEYQTRQPRVRWSTPAFPAPS